MILKKWSLALAAVMMMVAPLSASALGISVTNVSNTFLQDGEVVTIDLVLENATQEDVFGMSLGITGYDVNDDGSSLNNNLVLVGGSVTDRAFRSLLVTPGGNVVAGGLDNIRTAPTEQGQGPPFLDPLRISLFDGADLSSSNGDGTLDTGVDGNQINSGDVHFRVQFRAQGGPPGVLTDVTLNIGTGFFGNGAIGAGGQLLDFNNASVTLTVVPEPGTALLMGLGLAGLAAAGRR